MNENQKYDSNVESQGDRSMIMTKTCTEPLTLNLLNALLANFATGTISIYELWEQIESCGEECEQPSLCDDFGCLRLYDLENHIYGVDSDVGI
jgi:hypothetical protein